MNLSGRTALVTGATGGLGTAIALHLHRQGVSLVLTGRRRDVLEKLAKRVGAATIECDLSNPAAVDQLAQANHEVDILIANAALPASGSIDSLSVEDIDRALAVNLRAPIVLAKRLGESMSARRQGHIVFISSLAGKVASEGGSVYSATKFGLRGFALGLREDLFAHNVGVSCISPGFIREAGMFHDSGAQLPKLVGTSTPNAVGEAVIRAIERNRAEIDVAPVAVKAGAILATLAPEFAARAQRRMGAGEYAANIAAGQVSKRR